MWKGEEESGRVELQTVKKDGGGGGQITFLVILPPGKEKT